MLNAWIDQWRAQPLPIGFVVAYLLQVAMYIGAAGEISVVYGVARRRFRIGALIDTSALPPRQLRDEIVRSLCACLVFAIPTLAFLYYSGYTYPDTTGTGGVWPSSWSQAAWQVGGFLVLNDFCAYWTHRLLHTRGFSRYHSAHHRSRRVTPWSALSMHPVEAMLAQLPYGIFLAISMSADLPMGIGTLLILQLLLMVGQANSHSNYDPFSGKGWRWLEGQTLFHQLHHRFGRDNFGYMGPHWDHVFGTAAGPPRA